MPAVETPIPLTDPPLDKLVTVPQFAEATGFSQISIWRYIKSGLLPSYTLGKNRVRLDLRDAQHLVRPRQVAP